jgi:hypothetical protein
VDGADQSSRLDVKQVRRWKLIWSPLSEADPFDTAEELAPLRVSDRIKEQAIQGTLNACIENDDHLRRMASQVFGTREINGQQRLKHCALSLSRRPLGPWQ